MVVQTVKEKKLLTAYRLTGISTAMSKSKTSPKRKRAFAWLAPVIHARAKASAAMSGQDLQDWFAGAIMERLDREDRARKPASA